MHSLYRKKKEIKQTTTTTTTMTLWCCIGGKILSQRIKAKRHNLNDNDNDKWRQTMMSFENVDFQFLIKIFNVNNCDNNGVKAYICVCVYVRS